MKVRGKQRGTILDTLKDIKLYYNLSMNRTNVLAVCILIALLAVAAGVTYFFYITPNDNADSPALKDLEATDERIFTDLQGNPIDFTSFEGKVRVVNSWASWCPFCTQELRDFETLASEFKDKNVAVIAINRKEPKEQASAFLGTIQEFQNIVFAIDLTDAFYASTLGFAMPETIFYNSKGEVVMHQRGELNLEQMRTYTLQAIGEGE